MAGFEQIICLVWDSIRTGHCYKRRCCQKNLIYKKLVTPASGWKA